MRKTPTRLGALALAVMAAAVAVTVTLEVGPALADTRAKKPTGALNNMDPAIAVTSASRAVLRLTRKW